MSLDADHIVDRRRLRRKLTFWRVVAVLVAIVAIIGGAGYATLRGGALPGQPGSSVARITSATEVIPRSTLRAPSTRSVPIPFETAAFLIVFESMFFDTIERISSSIIISSKMPIRPR